MQTEMAVFGGGCFWCTEAVIQDLRGVIAVMPGYAGGETKNPTYEQVCGGSTGHAEAIRIEYDPTQITYKDLLTVFFATHDPTTLNRQGNDVGTQYRSIILTSNDQQRQEAEDYIKELSAAESKGGDIVTEVRPLDIFYEAEDYHRNYYKNNPVQPYCMAVINPKVRKAKEKFAQLLKS
jgi:peptide-methionine (S)-S-oxide reductase